MSNNERDEWAILSFTMEGKKNWCVPKIETPDGAMLETCELAIGQMYAMEFISYLRRLPNIDGGDGLADIVEAMFSRELTRIERMFFTSIGTFIRVGKLPVAGDFDAVLP